MHFLRRTSTHTDRWLLGYLAFTVALAAVVLARLLWSAPNAMVLSQFWAIEDIDRVQTEGLSLSSLWVNLGNEHALTGYRWFQYLSAALFGLNTQVEFFVYVGLALVLSIAVGVRVLSVARREGRSIPLRLVVFAVPLVAFTMVGAGSHGMELGQYAGITGLVLLVLGIESQWSPQRYALVAYLGAPLLTFLLLGGYAIPVALSLVLVTALQWVKPTLTRERRASLLALTYAFVGSAVVWLALMVSSGATGRNDAGGLDALTSAISADVLYPVKYLVGGFAASVINAYTLEGVPLGGTFAYLVGLLVIAFIVVCVVAAYRRAWKYATAPLILILFGPALGLSLMASRDGALWLLGPWYGYLFRLPLIGAIWLAALALTAPRRAATARTSANDAWPVAVVALLAAVLTVVGIANLAQWIRQPNERAFYQSVQNATLFPQELAVGPGGLTQLVLTMDETRRGIEVLKKHRLGLYRDPQGVIAASSSFTKRDGLATSGLSPDGWAGPRVRVVVTKSSCKRVAVQVLPLQYLSPRFAGRVSMLTVSPSFAPARRTKLGDRPVQFTLKPEGEFPTFDLDFSHTWNLQRLGISADGRDLSARVALRCV
jgi:hypothetical protein